MLDHRLTSATDEPLTWPGEPRDDAEADRSADRGADRTASRRRPSRWRRLRSHRLTLPAAIVACGAMTGLYLESSPQIVHLRQWQHTVGEVDLTGLATRVDSTRDLVHRRFTGPWCPSYSQQFQARAGLDADTLADTLATRMRPRFPTTLTFGGNPNAAADDAWMWPLTIQGTDVDHHRVTITVRPGSPVTVEVAAGSC